LNDPHFIIIRNLVDSMIYEQMTHHIFLYLFFQNFIIFFKRIKENWLFVFGKCIYDICLNECTNFFRKCTYEYMIFLNAYIVHVRKIFSKKNAFMNALFLFECIYDVCLNDFFCEKMHLWNLGLFLFENAFMNAWFFFWMHI